MVVLFCVLLCFVKISTQLSIKSDDHYIAAVVEYQYGSSNNTWKDYFNLVSEAAEKDVDIIVFPEGHYIFTKSIRVPIYGILKNNSVPALRPDLYDEALVLMSEAAKKYSMYVLINLHESLDCRVDSEEECKERKAYIFNTNVVFDRNGAVIARYRKTHLFFEPNVTASYDKEMTTFETDFGVKFGIVICFDMMNQVPFTQFVSKGVKNVIVSSMWVNNLPFISAVQTTQALAYDMDVNLLVSGTNLVTDYASGSGIYAGKKGTVISFITGVPSTKLLVAKVYKEPGTVNVGPGPIKQNPAYFDGLMAYKDYSLPSHVTKPIVVGNQNISLKFNDISCNFTIVMKERNGEKRYKYRAGAFSGVASLGFDLRVGVRDCTVFFCSNDSIDSCGGRFSPYVDNATAIFEELTIEATVPTPKQSFSGAFDSTFYPTSLDIYMLPLEPSDFKYTVKRNDTISVHTLELRKTDAQLYTFGFWGRQFDLDGGEVTKKYEEQSPEEIRKMIEGQMKQIMKKMDEAHDDASKNILIKAVSL